MIDEMEESLRQIEQGLDGNPVTAVTPASSSPATAGATTINPALSFASGIPAGGRAAFLSVASALTNLRQRVNSFREAHSNSVPGETTSEWTRQFSARLSTAELAHSTRAPLHRIGSALGRRDRLGDTTSTSDLLAFRASVAPEDAAESLPAAATVPSSSNSPGRVPPSPLETIANQVKDTGRENEKGEAAPPAPMESTPPHVETTASEDVDDISSSRSARSWDGRTPGSQRRPSVLHASRSKASLFDHRDMELHENGGAWVSSSPSKPSSLSGDDEAATAGDRIEPIDEDDDEDDNMKLSDTHNDDDDDDCLLAMDVEEEAAVAESSVHETPILLSESSHAKLDESRRSLLFPSTSAHSLPQSPLSAHSLDAAPATNKAVALYSWGAEAGSLHDDNVDKPWGLASALVSSSSRLGRIDQLVSVATSGSHSAVATPSGVLTCGLNDKGQVDPSNPSHESVPRPTLLESITVPIVQVSCGVDHTAAVTSTGVVLTWGSNEYGQLGHLRTPGGSEVFVRPQAMALSRKRAFSVACGEGFTMVLTTRMEVLCCGVQSIAGYETRNNMGSNECRRVSTLHPLPSTLPELECLPIVEVAAGTRHAAVVTAHGSVLTWGENISGCCGRASPKVLHIPVPIRIPYPSPEDDEACLFPPEGSAIVHVTCGDQHTVMVSKAGQVFVCGNNDEGQLGVNHDVDVVGYHVIPLPFDRKVVDAAAGRAHTLLLDNQGGLWQIGNGSSKPVLLLQDESHVSIAAGGRHSIAVSTKPWLQVPRTAAPSREFSNLVTGSKGSDGHESIECLINLVEGATNQVEGETGIEARDLAKRAEELVKTPAVLNSLFLDPRDLDDLFHKLISPRRREDRQAMASAVEQGMKSALEVIKSDNVRLLYPESMRFLLLYIQCPLFVDWNSSELSFDRRGDIMIAICEVILGLPFEGYKAFLSLVSMCYSRETMVKFLIRPLLKQLEKGLDPNAGPSGRLVPLVTAVLSWLHSASERAGGMVRPEDFYSKAVNEMDSKEAFVDLYRWKKASKVQRSTNFFICAHPFLFSPESKRNLLQIENQMEMFNTATAEGVTFNVLEGAFEFDPYWILEVERDQLLPQTLRKISDAKPNDLRKKLRIVFKGEDGVDAGGVTREFFQLISTQLFDVSSGMWLDQMEDEQVTWFNADCFWNDEGYYLVGILVGLAVYNNVLLDVNFPVVVYRKLLGLPLGLEDLPDKSVQKSLQQLLDYDGDDVEDVFCLSFAIDWMDLGRARTVELKPGGSSLPVSSENKEEYVRLYVKWLLEESIHPQYDAFERGFMKIMEHSTLEFLSPDELELLVVGTRDLDFDALEGNTEYDGGYDKDSQVIKNFWQFVKSSDTDTQLKLLKFATGCSKAPIGGLGKLRFKIQRAGPDSMQLPTSHTCFNTLLLHEYDSYDKLASQLGRAIEECEGFGLQ